MTEPQINDNKSCATNPIDVVLTGDSNIELPVNKIWREKTLRRRTCVNGIRKRCLVCQVDVYKTASRVSVCAAQGREGQIFSHISPSAFRRGGKTNGANSKQYPTDARQSVAERRRRRSPT